MILQALVKRYEDTKEEGISHFGWQNRFSRYAINISGDGDLLSLLPLGDLSNQKSQGIELLLPEAAKRSSGISPSFLCDNAQYFLGLFDEDKAAKDNKLEKRRSDAIKAFKAAGERHKQILGDIDSNAARGILRWFEKWNPELALESMPIKSLFSDSHQKKLLLQGNLIFIVDGKYAHEAKEISGAWDNAILGESRQTLPDNRIRCLVSGDIDTIQRLHGSIGLRGAQATAALISVNSDSFGSYGKTKDDPAAEIGQKAEFAYRTALKTLLKSDKHHQFLGQNTIVYWAAGSGEAEAEAFSWALQPTESDTDKLTGLMQSISRGLKVEIEGCDPARRFHVLCLSPNAGRISVRFFLSDSFGNMLTNVLNHYRNLEIITPTNTRFAALPPWMLVSETTVKKDAKDSAPLLAGQILNSILTGSRYPATLYNSILIRTKAGEGVNRTKAAIVKAVLIRNYKESEVTTVSLNHESVNKPYVLGRLFATLERLQWKANGSSNIKERYFGSASSNPGSVFPTLLKLSTHHSAKLDNATFYEKLKTSLLGCLDDRSPFPTALSLDDQGRFILGYYHQVQDFFPPKKNEENKEEQ
jgi:CRISPR-associated protein Csd1